MSTGEVRRPALIVIVCAVLAIGAAAVPPSGGFSYGLHDRSVYDVATVFLLALLLVGGATMTLADRAARRVGAVLGVAAGGQVAGTGVVAFRRWHTSGGFSRHAPNEATLRGLAVGIAVAGTIAVVASLVALRRDGAFHALGRRRGMALVGVVAAVGLAIAVPLVMGDEDGGRLTQVGAHALMYGLPWAFALLVGAVADRIGAIAAALAVVVSAAPLLGEILMIPAARPSAGFAAAVVAACVVAAAALTSQQQRHRGEPARRTVPVRQHGARRARRP